ncbi:hypothetical protein D9M68_854200 [compost metagenome]
MLPGSSGHRCVIVGRLRIGEGMLAMGISNELPVCMPFIHFSDQVGQILRLYALIFCRMLYQYFSIDGSVRTICGFGQTTCIDTTPATGKPARATSSEPLPPKQNPITAIFSGKAPSFFNWSSARLMRC